MPAFSVGHRFLTSRAVRRLTVAPITRAAACVTCLAHLPAPCMPRNHRTCRHYSLTTSSIMPLIVVTVYLSLAHTPIARRLPVTVRDNLSPRYSYAHAARYKTSPTIPVCHAPSSAHDGLVRNISSRGITTDTARCTDNAFHCLYLHNSCRSATAGDAGVAVLYKRLAAKDTPAVAVARINSLPGVS